jgi:maltooligosyltrehalose trehalohydrolase
MQTFPTPEQSALTDVGPSLHPDGVTYRVWALGHTKVTAHIEKPDGSTYEVALEESNRSGYFHGVDSRGEPGDLYRFSIDGAPPVPDFISHYQPQGPFGPSMIVDSAQYQWRARDWVRPVWDGQVIYECHVGTFSKEGTFRAAIEKLDHLVALGVTALEVMPVAEFPGERNWGYDGVLLFAPSHTYGTPDAFRELIDACHQRGLAVILDVVYNHLGPEGNFSHQYSEHFFHPDKHSPWGQSFNLDGEHSEPVRAILRQNIRYWLDSFRIDGFRMDATHMVHDESPVHILAEVAEEAQSRGAFIIAEDDRNERMILDRRDKKGWGFDAVWSDDFHHAIRVSQTGEQESFLIMFDGTVLEIAGVIRNGWLYSGQFSRFNQRERGTPGDDFPPQSFVFCISNHDQVGNRWEGVRFHEVIKPATYRALSLFLCLSPYTPLIFMGQEWAAGTPFHFFTDMSAELGKKIVEGRAREFTEAGFIGDKKTIEQMSNPQAETTFSASKLNWAELTTPGCANVLELYKAGLHLRRELFGGKNPPRRHWYVESDENSVTVHYQLAGRQLAVHFRVNAGHETPVPIGKVLLQSSAPEFGGADELFDTETIVIEEA